MTRTFGLTLALLTAGCGEADNELVSIGTTDVLDLPKGTTSAPNGCALSNGGDAWEPFPSGTSCYCLEAMAEPGDEGILAVWVDADEPIDFFRVDATLEWRKGARLQNAPSDGEPLTSRPFAMTRSSDSERVWTLGLTRSEDEDLASLVQFRIRGFLDRLRTETSNATEENARGALRVDTADTGGTAGETGSPTGEDTDEDEGGSDASETEASPCAD